MPIGTIVASVRMASIARPSFGVWSSAVGLRVPSGKTTRTWPASRTRWARRNASMSALARSTGTTPPLRAIQPTIGQSNISFLPSQWIRRQSRRRCGGRPDRRDDRLDRLVEGVAVGHDVDRVLRRPEWGHVTIAVERVAPSELGQDETAVGAVRIDSALLRASPRPFLDG